MKSKITQQLMYNVLRKSGIEVNLHYAPVYLQPYYQAMGFKRGYCPNAEIYFKSAISIPIFAGLSYENQSKIIEIISNECMK